MGGKGRNGLRGHLLRIAAALPPRGPRVAGGQRAGGRHAQAAVQRGRRPALSSAPRAGRKARSQGWLHPQAPAKYGGGSWTLDHAIIVVEEVDRVGLSLPPYYDSGGRLGAVDPGLGHRGAEAGVPAADLHGPGPDVAAPHRARRRLRTSRASGRRPSATATSTSSTARRSSSAATTAPTASG